VKLSILILSWLLAVSSSCFSQSEKATKHAFPGMSNWDEVVSKATSDNKYIMVDLSTEWCTWCKVMDKKHFTDPEILSLMQPKLNSYMLDAEKDSLGQLLKLKYGVAAYPSFLFFTPKGEYIETWCGAMPKEYWIQYIKDSIDQVPMSRPGIPSGLEFKWPDFVQKELNAQFKKSTPSSKELSQFFAICNYKQFVDFNVCRFYPRDIPDSLLAVMLLNKEWLDSNYGADIATDLLQTSINWKAYAQIQDSNWTKAWSYMNQYQKYFPQNEWELFNVKLFYYKSKIEVDSIIQLGLQYPSFIYDYTAIEMVEFICNYGKTDAQFRQAELWNIAELNKQTTFKLAKFQAQIKYKQSDIPEAQKWAKIAIESAEREGVLNYNDDVFLKKLVLITETKNKS
jgi:thioredoxin-related protein